MWLALLGYNAQIKLVLAIATGRSFIRISVQKLDFRTELKMINGPSVYDSGALGTNWPDFKAFFDRPTPKKIRPYCQNHIQREGRLVPRAPESYTEGPFIIFHGRKSIFGRKFQWKSFTKTDLAFRE